MSKVNNKSPEQRYQSRSSAFINNLEHVSHEQVNASCGALIELGFFEVPKKVLQLVFSIDPLYRACQGNLCGNE